MSWLNDALAWVIAGLATYGYIIVLLAAVAENLFVVGSFMPGDLIVAAAAFTASTSQGHALSPWLIWAIAILGALIGANISYQIGLRAGREFIERVGIRVGISADMIEAAEVYFERNGPMTIVFARWVAVMKNMAPALAGASKMNIWLFELYSIAGATLYVSVLVGIGTFLGANFEAGLKLLGGFSWGVFAVVIVAVVVLWRARKRRQRVMVAELDAEYEAEHGGPLEAEDADDNA
ncbi:MAG: DedA family protein [Coriobacteriia bacterium]|nr:DedA family protein [Coriobacteriia bacterium]